jgi:anhydro-N-acetylmuramic acid kinase
MSGTSGDGVDVAMVRIAPRTRAGTGRTKVSVELQAHRGFAFPAGLRAAVLAAQDARRTTTAELARLHWRLGLAYSKALTSAMQRDGLKPELVGCHGQTVYHQARTERYLGARFGCTWQIGEMAPLAAAAGVPVISNFRPADMVAGGQGAPLVPLLDEMMYRDRARVRILQNIGGIGNLTCVPDGMSDTPTVAFDTGPGNMVIDALMQKLYGRPYDKGGQVAASGRVLLPVVEELLLQPFFAQKPPKSAGREQFGPEFCARLLRLCRAHKAQHEDVIATATALTAHSIAQSYGRFLQVGLLRTGAGRTDCIVSGGGARNRTLVASLGELLEPMGARVLLCSDKALPAPIPVEAKEAVAFALLAYLSWHGRAGNVPTATGAAHAVVLGQVTCA